MSETYWMSDVLKCVYQLKKLNDDSVDLVDVTDASEMSLPMVDFKRYDFVEIPEEELGIVLLQVCGEPGVNFAAIFAKMAALVDAEDYSGGGVWARHIFKLRDQGHRPPPGMQSQYLTPARLKKIIAYSHTKFDEEQAARKAKRNGN